jgi:hypothetical protein
MGSSLYNNFVEISASAPLVFFDRISSLHRSYQTAQPPANTPVLPVFLYLPKGLIPSFVYASRLFSSCNPRWMGWEILHIPPQSSRVFR